MTERSTDHAPSTSSSVTEAEAYDENEKHGMLSETEGGFVKLKSPDDLELGDGDDDDDERAEMLPAEHEKPAQSAPEASVRSSFIWMVVNTLATIGIVSSTVPRASRKASERPLTHGCFRSSRTKQSFRTLP
jgi:solute carrier family 35 protein E3